MCINEKKRGRENDLEVWLHINRKVSILKEKGKFIGIMIFKIEWQWKRLSSFKAHSEHTAQNSCVSLPGQACNYFLKGAHNSCVFFYFHCHSSRLWPYLRAATTMSPPNSHRSCSFPHSVPGATASQCFPSTMLFPDLKTFHGPPTAHKTHYYLSWN